MATRASHHPRALCLMSLGSDPRRGASKHGLYLKLARAGTAVSASICQTKVFQGLWKIFLSTRDYLILDISVWQRFSILCTGLSGYSRGPQLKKNNNSCIHWQTFGWIGQQDVETWFEVFLVSHPGFHYLLTVWLLRWLYTEFIKDVMRVSSRNSDVLKFVVTWLTVVKCYIHYLLYDLLIWVWLWKNLRKFLKFCVFKKWWWEVLMCNVSFQLFLKKQKRAVFFTFRPNVIQYILKWVSQNQTSRFLDFRG